MTKNKIILAFALLVATSAALAQSQIARHAAPALLSWGFSAPSVSGASSNLPSANGGDIAFDVSSSPGIFKGYNGSSWVNFGGPGATNLAVRSVTSTDSCTSADDALILSGSSFVETLFTAVGNTGKVIRLVHTGTSLSNVYTLNTTSGQTIGGVAGGSYALYTNGEELTVMSDGSNWQILSHKTDSGPLSAGSVGTLAGTGGGSPAFGTTSTNAVTYYRRGKYAIINYSVVQTSAGTNPTGDILVPLPSNMTLDTSTIPVYTGSVGTNLQGVAAAMPSVIPATGVMGAAVGSSINSNVVVAYSTTQFRVSNYSETGSVSGGNWSSSYFALSSTSLFLNITITAPISGWQP